MWNCYTPPMFYIYELRDEAGAVFYVGKGSGRRMYQHSYKAKHGQDTPRAQRIREIWARGGTVHPCVVFTTADESEAYAEECRLIAQYGRDSLTNQTAGGCGIRLLSLEARQKIAASRKGKKASEATRQRQRNAKLGYKRSESTKAKIAEYQRGTKKPWASLPRSEEHRRKLSTFKGRKHAPETIAKMAAAKTGHSVSEETRAKISATRKGIPPWNKGMKFT